MPEAVTYFNDFMHVRVFKLGQSS